MSNGDSTGFPTLPEGYFWEVKEVPVTINTFLGYSTIYPVSVIIRRKRWYGSRWVVKSNLLTGRNELKPTTEKNLIEHAYKAFRMFDDLNGGSITESEEYLARKKYIGTYPPKNLENL